MSRMTAGRLWGLDAGDWSMLLGGIAVVGLLGLAGLILSAERELMLLSP